MSAHFKTIIFVLGVLLGIVAGEVTSYSSEIALGAALLAVTQGALLVYRRWRAVDGGYGISLLTILFSVGLFLGITRVQLVEEKTKYVCDASCTFEAKVATSPQIKNDYQVFSVSPLGVTDEVLDVQIRTPLYPKYTIGETLKISGKVSEPNIMYPHSDKKSFDYASYLLTRNVGSEMLFPKIEIVDSEAHSVPEYLGRWREGMVEKINLLVSSPASSLASGMLFGNFSMSKELTQTFRVAGLSHIVVLSGFNIAIVISFILFVFTFLPLTFRVVMASISVLLFVTMVGGEVGVIRATLMAFVSLLATFTGREYVAKQALIISLLLIVLYEPYALLHDVSLHLSFLATAGIIYISEPISVILKKYLPKLQSKSFLALLTTTLCAYFATLPYLMYTFGMVSVYALLANIVVLPFVPVTMLISFLVVSSSYVSDVLASFFGFIDTIIINGMIWVAEVVELLPFSYLSFEISFVTTCVVYLCIITVIAYLLTKTRDETKSTVENGFLTDTISF